MTNNERTALIRALNDQLRRHQKDGHVMVTPGVRAMGESVVARLLAEIARFDGFQPDNDPYEEHDCATLDIEGQRIIWKIDYYDRKMVFASPDPADPDVTERVMTVMLGEEY